MKKGKTTIKMVVVVGEKYCSQAEREVTVRKITLFYPGDGFAAYDPASGELVFRVDTYGPSATGALSEELVLMDPAGAAILTLRRRWPSLHHRWEGFLGDRADGQQPIFTVKRPSLLSGARRNSKSYVEVEVHTLNIATLFHVEGSFAQRCCKVLQRCDDDESVVVAAEIRRKVDACAHHAQVVMGKDVFSLWLGPGFDAAFAMGIVLVLDRIDKEEPGATETTEVEAPKQQPGGEKNTEAVEAQQKQQRPLTIAEILSSDTDRSD